METAPSLRSFPLGSAGNISHPWHSSEKPGLAAWHRSGGQDLTHGKLTLSVRQAGITVLCAKAPKETVLPTSDVPLDDGPESSTEKHGLRSATLSNAIQALILQICDETSIAEVHMRVGEFELDLKRNVGATNGPVAVAPPVPTAPMDQSTPATPSRSSQKSSTEKANPFPSFSSAVSSKLASLEAAGITGYKLVASPRVGSFRKGRTVKGKKQPPICKQGDVIKEGQVIGYVDQFGTELPVKSDVAGEVLKLLFDDGEAVGYGDPLVAVLPSFRGLN